MIHAEQFSVLLFSKTAGWHHESILEGVKAIRGLGQLHDFNVFWTEDATAVRTAIGNGFEMTVRDPD